MLLPAPDSKRKRKKKGKHIIYSIKRPKRKEEKNMRSRMGLLLILCSFGFFAAYPWIAIAAEDADTPISTLVPPAAQRGDRVRPAGGIGKDISSENRQSDRFASRISMSFDKADIGSVLKYLSTVSRTPIVADPDISGNITIVSMKDITLAEAYEVVNAVLKVRGYTMVGGPGSKVIRVVPLQKAVADNTDVRAGKDPQQMAAGDSMVTQVIPLDFVNAVKLKDELKPLVSDNQASLTAISSTNTVIVTDTAGNVRRIAAIIKELDKDNSDILDVEIYTCRYASASSLADTVAKIFQSKQDTPANITQMSPSRQQQQAGQVQVQLQGNDGLISLKGELRIAADERTNSLIVSASKERVKLVMEMVKKLDVDTEPEVKARVFPLQYADAGTVANQLSLLFEQATQSAGSGNLPQRRNQNTFGGAVMGGNAPASGYAGLKRNTIVADVRTNSVVVTATEQNMKAFETMIKELDAPKVLSEITRHFALKYATASELATTLNNLFQGRASAPSSSRNYLFTLFNSAQTSDGPLAQLKNITVVAETKTNSLLVTGPPNSFSVIENLIEKLDMRTTQVFVEVAIVDVTLDDNTKFGLEWSWTNPVSPSGRTQEGGADFSLAKESTGFKYSIVSDNIQALLHALKTRTDVKVLSTPTITTADNVEARISIGQDEPFVSSETETEGGYIRRTVEFKNVAIALTVTPHVNGASDVIAMEVHQTINEIVGRDSRLNAPIIASREAQTKVTVRDGQTIVIGGIIKNNRERINNAVPILSELPLIGNLFKSSQWADRKSELMVFLTPRILKSDEDVSVITDKAKAILPIQPQKGLSGEKK